MRMPQFQPEIKSVGQAYQDIPIVDKGRVSRVHREVFKMYNPPNRYVDGVNGQKVPVWEPVRPILLRYECTPLKWMKPDGKGGVIPR